MRIGKAGGIRSSEITPDRDYISRRKFIGAAGITAEHVSTARPGSSASLAA